MTLDFVVIVPARRASSRLPDKPLADIGGVPMVVRTLHRAADSGASRILAAVDDSEIADTVRQAGYEYCMTGECDSGTSRAAEAAQKCGLSDATVVVNVQADEPFIEPELIKQVASLAQSHGGCFCASAMRPARDETEYNNPSSVKVVVDANGMGRYFSRAPIPHNRDSSLGFKGSQIHIGVYAYTVGNLRRLPELSPSPLEKAEQLEQLRILWHGYDIMMLSFDSESEGVDTPEDLSKARLRANQ